MMNNLRYLPFMALVMFANGSAQDQKGYSEADVKKAELALAINADDPDANLTMGKYLAFSKGDWDKALPHLSKSSDATLKSAAQKDLAGAKAAAEHVALGDEWLATVKKHPKEKRFLEERAISWYAKAWPELEGGAKDKMRDKLRKLLQNPAVQPVKALAPIKTWTGDAAAKVGVSSVAAHSGNLSAQVFTFKAGRAYCPIGQSVSVKPGEAYKLSCWVLTDGTDQPEALRVHVVDAKGTNILIKGAPILSDQPWWKKVELDFDAGKDAVLASIDVAVSSPVGSIFIDDFTVQAANGPNLVKNPGFEEK